MKYFTFLSVVKQILIVILFSGCTNAGIQGIISSKDVNRIEIWNGTNNRNIANKITITSRLQIEWLIREVNRMTLLDSEVGIKSNFGVYEMKIEMDNNTEIKLFVIYTTYNGVVIQGYNKSGTAMDQYYKNDDLESAILHLFQP
jgi:hypothetical protein